MVPEVVVPGAYCARLFRSLSTRGSAALPVSVRCGPAVDGAGPVRGSVVLAAAPVPVSPM